MMNIHNKMEAMKQFSIRSATILILFLLTNEKIWLFTIYYLFMDNKIESLNLNSTNNSNKTYIMGQKKNQITKSTPMI